MLNIISGFFEIKRLQRELHETELAYLNADLELARIESKLIELEDPSVQPHLAHEFAMQRAFSRMGFSTKSSTDCIEMARLWAKMFNGASNGE